MSAYDYDVVVIGAGPGGYVSAIRASQLKLKTAIVERDALGGVCLNWGCIPSKALLKSAEVYEYLLSAKDYGLLVEQPRADITAIVKRSRQTADRLSKGIGFLMKKNRIPVLEGVGVLVDEHTILVTSKTGTETRLTAGSIIIATGGEPRTFPGLQFDGDILIHRSHALVMDPIPPSLMIIGGGAIGIEFAYYFNVFGCKVTIVEMLDRLLPVEDLEISKELEKHYRKRGIEVLTGVKVTKVEKLSDHARIEFAEGQEPREAAKILVAIGVIPNIKGIGLEQVGIATDRGYIKVDEYCRTSLPHIYAIGDVAKPPLLAHKASAEGILAAESIAGVHSQPVDYAYIPGCTFCKPQVASLGYTEAKARELFGEVKIGKFFFRGIGKAIATGDYDGFVKLVVDANTDKILGAHLIGPEVTELIAVIGNLQRLGGTARDLHTTIHAHPTLSEILPEAAGQVHGLAIHG